MQQNEMCKSMVDDEYMVSVWCLTYNHIDYIKDALEGFVNQKTNFKYKIVVYDDASTDGTSDVLREYKRKYPDLFELIISQENRFRDPERNEYMLKLKRSKLKGKYVALCEGDDYWLDPHKLQIQVDYMETHSDCSMYMHNAIWMDYREKRLYMCEPYETNSEDKILEPSEVILQSSGHPPTASFMVRREIYDRDEFFFTSPIGDYPLQLAALSKGYIYFDRRIMSVYRWMTSGSYNNTLAREQALSTYFHIGIIEFLIKFDRFTDYKYTESINEKIQRFAVRFIEDLDDSQSIEKVIMECQKGGYALGSLEENTLEKLEKLKGQMKDEAYLDEKMRKFISAHKEVWIIGAGKYAKVISAQLEHKGIEFQGFAVSDISQNPREYCGKRVVKISDVATSEIGLIIAILPYNEGNLREELRGVAECHIFRPFELRV